MLLLRVSLDQAKDFYFFERFQAIGRAKRTGAVKKSLTFVIRFPSFYFDRQRMQLQLYFLRFFLFTLVLSETLPELLTWSFNSILALIELEISKSTLVRSFCLLGLLIQIIVSKTAFELSLLHSFLMIDTFRLFLCPSSVHRFDLKAPLLVFSEAHESQT